MANKNLLKSKAVLKAISIGLAAMMAMTPVAGAVDVLADEPTGENNNPSESNTVESNTTESSSSESSSEYKAVEEKYEEAKEELVPDAPEDAVTSETTDENGNVTVKTEFTEEGESSVKDTTIETTTSEDGSSEEITVTTDETTTESEQNTEYTYNSETVSKEEYFNKVDEIKGGNDQDGKPIEYATSEPIYEDVLDENGNKIGTKAVITEEATFVDDEGYTVTKTIKTTVISYDNVQIDAPVADTPVDPTKISLGDVTDSSSSTTVQEDGTIIIETSEKKVSAYKSEPSTSETSKEVENTVSEETVEVSSYGTKTVVITSFATKEEAEAKAAELSADKNFEVVETDGRYEIVETIYVNVDEPEDITVSEGDGIAEFDLAVKDKYKEDDGWDIKSSTDDTTGTTTWRVVKTVDGVTVTYKYSFTPQKETLIPESSVTIYDSDTTAEAFFANHLSEYTEENGWKVSKTTEGNSTKWIISKEENGVFEQYTYVYTATKESTPSASTSYVYTEAADLAGLEAEIKEKYKEDIKNGTVTITRNKSDITVVKKGSNPFETVTETYNYYSENLQEEQIEQIAAYDFEQLKERVIKKYGSENVTIDEADKKCSVFFGKDGKNFSICYHLVGDKPGSG